MASANPPGTKMLSARLPLELVERLQRNAQAAGLSISEAVRVALEGSLDKCGSDDHLTVPTPTDLVVRSGDGSSWTYRSYTGATAEIERQLDPHQRPGAERPGSQMKITGLPPRAC